MAFNSLPKKQNPEDKPAKKKKSFWREWLDAAVFAIVAATIIRTFLIEAYTIPTGSMEGSLLINDYLFVSKVAYGPRMPMTPLSVPLVHNTMPLVGGKSYSESVKWKYKRWPGLGQIERNDIVVFNFPVGDTVSLERQMERDYYTLLREANGDRAKVWANNTIITRPVDKKENFIKRCVGLPGDEVSSRNGILSVNGAVAPLFPHAKLSYIIESTGGFSEEYFDDNNIEFLGSRGTMYQMLIPNDAVETVKNTPGVTSVQAMLYPPNVMGSPADWAFPQDTVNFKWNRDNFGPLTIPASGTTVTLTAENIALYRRIITNYEGNTLQENQHQFIINGEPATTYTFQQDYYWMMGDNRHNSADSRYWGFVPIDHVVGKASFVWLSYGKNGIRWNRILRGIKTLEK